MFRLKQVQTILFLFLASAFIFADEYCKAKILSISNLSMEWSRNLPRKQLLNVKILSGENKGKIVGINNLLWPEERSYYNFNFKVGDIIIARCFKTKFGSLSGYAALPNRGNIIIWCLILFFIILVLVSGKKGAKASLALILIYLIIFLFFVPGLKKGYPPIFILLAVSILSTVITMFLVGGLNKKSVSAILGCIVGIISGLIFCYISIKLLKIYGVKTEIGRMFLSIFESLPVENLIVIIISGIIISALGAIMDLAIGIASSMNEIVIMHREIKIIDLFKSGFLIGRDALTTMIGTLIFGYSGGMLAFLLVFKLLLIPLNVILSWEFISLFVITILSGCIGMIMTLPGCVIFSCLILKNRLNLKPITFFLIVISILFPIFIFAWVEPPDVDFHINPIAQIYKNKEIDEYVKAKAISVIKIDENNFRIIAKILQGTFKGKETEITHYLWGDKIFDIQIKSGDLFLLWLRKNSDGTIKKTAVYDYYRNTTIYFLILFTVLLFVLIGGKKALRLVFTFIFAGASLFYFLLPAISNGMEPLILTFTTSLFLIITTIIFIYGFKPQTLVAFISALIAIIFAFGISFILKYLLKVNGSTIESLQLLNFYSYNFKNGIISSPEKIFICMVIISLIGAVLDVVITLTSALFELKRKVPQITKNDFIRSGVNIGYDMMGTMVNTLILIFTGTELSQLLLWSFTGISYLNLINLELISVIVLKSIAGTLSMIISVPVVCYAAAKLLNIGDRMLSDSLFSH